MTGVQTCALPISGILHGILFLSFLRLALFPFLPCGALGEASRSCFWSACYERDERRTVRYPITSFWFHLLFCFQFPLCHCIPTGRLGGRISFVGTERGAWHGFLSTQRGCWSSGERGYRDIRYTYIYASWNSFVVLSLLRGDASPWLVCTM